MRRPAALLALGLVAAALTGCSTDAAGEKPLVVATTNILGDVVTNLVGDDVEVMTLMKPDADPHSFEISAQEAARMQSADLVVSNGLGLEEGLQQHLDTVEGEQLVAGDVIEVLEYTDGDAAGADDPHFWTDPARVLQLVDALEPALAEVGDTDAVAAAASDYRDELGTLETEMSEAFEAIPADRRALVTNHHVFGYLAERFDFEVIGAVIPGGTTLAAPSASDLRDLTSAIDEAGVPTIFAESSSPDRLVQVLADEAGVDVDVVELYTESLTAADGGAPDYLTMMRVNTQRISDGLA
jgi:zinc/manganese transport system substrate-binding protein